MNQIKNDTVNEILVNKSKFITYLFKLQSFSDIKKHLSEVKDLHPKANHHCYAYIFENKIKTNDDKEPSNTAGMPIYNVLMQNDLTNVLCVVVRYFGGIKLGAGGLVRAYSNSTSKCLKKTGIKKFEEYINYELNFKYENINFVNHLLKDKEIISKSFEEEIIFAIKVQKGNTTLIKELKKYCKIKNYE